jgi:hypothetical protein
MLLKTLHKRNCTYVTHKNDVNIIQKIINNYYISIFIYKILKFYFLFERM